MPTTPLSRCRSALYLPASNTRAIEKSRGIDTDAIIFDLEDSVAGSALTAARRNLLDGFASGFGDSVTAIRCNAIGSAAYLDDLQAIRDCKPQVLLLPKVTGASDIDTFETDAVTAGLPAATACWYMIETVAAIAGIADIVSRGVAGRWPLTGLIIGHNDLATESGVSLSGDRQYLLPWLMQVVLQARLHKLLILDSVYNNFRDVDGFEREALQGRQMGFDGKTLIHPVQVAPANRVFSPDADEIAAASAIVAAFSKPENQNAAVINLDGEMVERLHLQQAERLLSKIQTR